MRRSTFPPVLQDYYSGVEPTVGISCSFQPPPMWKNSMVTSGGGAYAAKGSRKAVADWKKSGAMEGSSSGVRLLLRNERELELRKKAKVNVPPNSAIVSEIYTGCRLSYILYFACREPKAC